VRSFARVNGVEMPILRYFVYVGGALLSLLLVSSVVLPQVPLPSTLTSGSDLPTVRIHSDRKLPERVVFDTSSTVAPATAPVAKSMASTTPMAAPEISPKARVREAFAQLPEGEGVSQPANVTQPKMTSKSQPKRKIVAASRPRAAQSTMMVAQQPRFGQTTW